MSGMTTSLSPTFDQGDVFVVFVPFSNQPLAGMRPKDPQAYQRNGLWGKDRPVVIVSARKHNRMEDLLVASFTTEVDKARRRGEYVLGHSSAAGLDEESAIRPRLTQIVKSDIVRPQVGKIELDVIWSGCLRC